MHGTTVKKKTYIHFKKDRFCRHGAVSSFTCLTIQQTSATETDC